MQDADAPVEPAGDGAAISINPDAFARDIQTLWNESVAWVGNHWLQVSAAAAAGTIIVLLMLATRRLGARLCREGEFATDWRTVIGRVASRTRLWFMIAFAAKLVGGMASPPEVVTNVINIAFTIAFALQGALWARELAIGVIEHRVGDHSDQSTLGSAMGIIRLLISFTLFAIAGVLILDNLGVNVTGLVAGLGIGGIAIGLAAKGIFDDLFSALSIIFDKPFRRGDSIKYDDTSGTVEAIGLKSTRIRAISGEQVVISNTNLLGKELHNMARLKRRRHVVKIGLTYQTPPEICARIPDMLRAIVEGEEKCTLVRAGMTGFGDSSLDFELQFDVHSDVYDEVFAGRHKVCVAILKAFNEAKLEFAYPTQVSFTAAPDGTLVMPYTDTVELTRDGDEADLFDRNPRRELVDA